MTDLEADLVEAVAMSRTLRLRLGHQFLLLRLIGNREQHERHVWRVKRMRRRLTYWERRVIRLRRQLQEVSVDEYPRSYLRVMRTAADVRQGTASDRRHRAFRAGT